MPLLKKQKSTAGYMPLKAIFVSQETRTKMCVLYAGAMKTANHNMTGLQPSWMLCWEKN